MEKPKIGKVYGIVLLVAGILWLAAIFMRGEGPLWSKKGYSSSYQSVQEQSIEQKTEQITKKKKPRRPFSLRKHVPKMLSIQFWAIACWELLCALLFLVSGFALLRGYPFQRKLVIYTLMADIVLKVLLVTYHRCILTPLSSILAGKNTLIMYFAPDAGLASKASSYLAGIKLIQPGAFYYGFFYALFLLGSFYVVTQLKTKKYFKTV